MTEQHTKVDWARFVRALLDGPYAATEKVVLVMDNLNTRTPASLDEACVPTEAQRPVEKLELHYTPKHGSCMHLLIPAPFSRKLSFRRCQSRDHLVRVRVTRLC